MLRVRPFKKSDVDGFLAVMRKCRRWLGDLYNRKTLLKAAEHTRFWVAESKGKIVGHVGFVDLKNGIGMLCSLAVDPAYRGKGIGRKLIKAVKRYAKRKGFRKIIAITRLDNKPAMILLIKEGFVPEGTLMYHFRTGEHMAYFSYFLKKRGETTL